MSDHTGARLSDEGDPPLVEPRNVSKRFVVHDSLLHRLFGGREYLRAVDDVSLSIHEGETVELVGEN